jgi:lactam utilization protein B
MAESQQLIKSEASIPQSKLLDWAQKPAREIGWLRSLNRDLHEGFDMRRLQTGFALSRIVSDDQSVFADRKYNPHESVARRAALVARLEWEVDLERILPRQIRDRIRQTLEYVKTHEWVDDSAIEETYKVFDALRQYIIQKKKQNKQLTMAEQYYWQQADYLTRLQMSTGFS